MTLHPLNFALKVGVCGERKVGVKFLFYVLIED